METPLCVDLDGTLCKGDMTVESTLLLLKNAPLVFFRSLPLLIKGKSPFKRIVAQNVSINPTYLPLNRKFLDFLKGEKDAGRKLLLVSASDEILVKQVGDHVGIFDESIGSNGVENLKSAKKAQYLVDRFGEKGFDYAGNDEPDFKVWERARNAVVVNASPFVESAANKRYNVSHVFKKERARPLSVLESLRAYQWLKNLLLLLPLVLAHKVLDLDLWSKAIIAFLAFSLCASAIYVLNDAFDLEADRMHARKRFRPLPAGDIQIADALLLATLCFAGAILLCSAENFSFLLCLLSYFVVCFAYSFYLKKIPLVDILILALLYVLRVLSGGVAVGVDVSHWLLAFSMFMFLSLACVKRYSELFQLRTMNGDRAHGRGYEAGDIDLIGNLGAASGYISILVLAMYISSSEVTILYHQPRWLWLSCPLILYWISRVWLMAHRGRMNEDPILFAATDKASYAVALLCFVLLVLAI